MFPTQNLRCELISNQSSYDVISKHIFFLTFQCKYTIFLKLVSLSYIIFYYYNENNPNPHLFYTDFSSVCMAVTIFCAVTVVGNYISGYLVCVSIFFQLHYEFCQKMLRFNILGRYHISYEKRHIYYRLLFRRQFKV